MKRIRTLLNVESSGGKTAAFLRMMENYVCSLDEKSLKKAKDELNEDPKERLSAVDTFKNWILEQPHIICPTDTLFLLSFLRARKFSQLESRALLDKYLTMKTKHKEWFEDIDPLNPAIQTIISEGFMFPGPKKNSDSQSIMFVNFPKLQPWSGRYTKHDVFRAIMCMTYHAFFIDEALQVNGVVVFDDLSGMTLKHQTAFTIEEQRSFFGGWHRCIPARMKKFCLYNLGAFGDFVLTIVRATLPETLQSRLMNCGSVLENIYKEIPMECLPVEYLPDDYKGPNAGTIKELVEKYRADLSRPEMCERIRFLSSSKFRVNEAKRPKDIPAESFRKLSVD